MALNLFDYEDALVVLTGAAAGIGEQLAAVGSSLVLVDRDRAGLERVAGDLNRRHGPVEVSLRCTDLADADAVADLIRGLQSTHPQVDMLINNAGVALAGNFAHLSDEEFDWLMAINFQAPVRLCRGLIPLMDADAHIVNISSLFGIIGPASQSAYTSSKFALRGFSEVLREELRPLGIGVTCAHPGAIRTGIARHARIASSLQGTDLSADINAFDALLTYPADRAATKILNAARRRRPRVLIGAAAIVPDLLVRVAPVHHAALLRRFMAVTGSKERDARTLADGGYLPAEGARAETA